MPRWLERTSTASAGSPADTPQRYELTCTCGNGYQGYREPHAQELICEQCGEALFVLPVDVYPQPKPPAPSRAARRKKAAESAAPKRPRVPIRKRLAGGAGAARARVGRGAASLWSRTRRLVTPLRAVVLLLVLVVASTAWMGLRAKSRDRAELSLRDSTARGEQALKEGDFPAASAEFGTAVAALDVLGRDDERARQIRQWHRETTAASRLATLSLYEIAHEAKAGRRGADAAWDDYFSTHYGGQWVVIDTTVEPASRTADGRAVEIHYPLSLGDAPVVLRADPAVFRGVVSGKDPQRVVFAGQLASCRFVASPSPQWVIGLQRETTFLWTDADIYAALGFEPDDLDPEPETREILERQSRIVGIDP